MKSLLRFDLVNALILAFSQWEKKSPLPLRERVG